ncbi:EAL domain-containing protein [Exilibacterium tricleocarpae]|uniref:EAL domain-containing protein n=1 Tax=Exilibacterium tricleocarpae TaxID=2591008 RepID=A0A545T3N9_9GAMM|nr:EAL domain-containing protein [Exilibacterium tricleocarpae]TQV71843.1 EAL domain-containing protein [Exilibacterium tricleocarpae]
MNPNDTIRLLILNDARDEAERLVSMLRNAGRPSRAQHVDSEEALVKLLQEQVWELLIGHDQTQNITPQTAIKQIKRLNKDVPVILQTDEEGSKPIVDGIKQGAADVVRLDEDQHLLLVIQRELECREQRQLRRKTDRRFREAERRSQQLLDSSRDAVAYIQDGMYLYANESFAERFGYDDRDDIECMPVIDMVADEEQDKIKQFFKSFILKADDAESSTLEFTGIRADESKATFHVEVAHAIYDEEPCIQFMMRASQASNEELEQQINQIKHQDVATGLYNRQYLMETLERAVDAAANDNRSSVLFDLEIDNFLDSVQGNLGVAAADQVLSNIATLTREHCSDRDTLARFADGNFMLLVGSLNADAALDRAEDLCRKIEDHIVEVDGKTIQLTVSIGIALVTESSSSAEAVIEQAMEAAASVRNEHDQPGVGNGAKLFEPKLSAADMEHKDVAQAVQSALDKGRFRLLFQPIISLRGSEEEHYEVLLRMLNDADEEISPSEFLATATQIGAATKIDRWVILEAIKVLSEHRSNGNRTRLIVNLSSDSLSDATLLPWLNVAFKAASLPTDAVVFQVSEVDVTNHLNAAKVFATGLKEMKSSCSISKFGCSLNPFNTLKHVPAEYIKVDGSFTLDIQNNGESPETLTNLVKQLHEESKTTIVPFVENASVLSTLWQAGVHYIQGHYLQAPTNKMDYDFNMES